MPSEVTREDDKTYILDAGNVRGGSASSGGSNRLLTLLETAPGLAAGLELCDGRGAVTSEEVPLASGDLWMGVSANSGREGVQKACSPVACVAHWRPCVCDHRGELGEKCETVNMQWGVGRMLTCDEGADGCELDCY